MSRFFNRMLTAALVALLLCASTPAFAVTSTESNSSTSEPRTVVVGYMDYAGFIEDQGNGKYTGYGVDYMNAIAQRENWNVEYRYYNWADLIGTVDPVTGERNGSALLDGEVDLILQAQKTDERARDFLYSDYAIGYESTIVYVRSDNDEIYYDDQVGLSGKKIGALQNGYQTEEFQKYASEKGIDYTPVYYSSDSEQRDALTQGQVDAIITGSLALYNEFKVVYDHDATPYYMICSPQNADLMAQANNALSDIVIEDPLFQGELANTYYGKSVANSYPKFTREEIEYVKQAGVIRIGQHANRQPISSYNADTGEFSGINEDVLDYISELSGLEFECVPISSDKTVPQALSDGDFDLFMGMDETAAYANGIRCTRPYLLSNLILVVKHGTTLELSENPTVAVPGTFLALKDYMAENYPDITLIERSSNEECLQAVADGKADATVQNDLLVNTLLQSPRFEDLETVPFNLFGENDVIGAGANVDPILISILDKSIDSIPSENITQIRVTDVAGSVYTYKASDVLKRYGVHILFGAILFVIFVAAFMVIMAMRRRHEKALEKKNEQLADSVRLAQTASGAKSDFLAQMSHEIRTPMNAIIGLTELARTEVDDQAATLSNLEKIDSSSHVLLQLINDILDMSAIESRKMKLESREFDIARLITDLTTVYYLQAKEKGVEFDVSLGSDIDEMLIGDDLRLNQILLNLLSNALKFTDKGGRICLKIIEHQKDGSKAFLHIEVSDTGIGMDEEALSRIFDPFEQAAASTARLHGGSGLGLSITKNLIDMMKGSIDVKSEPGVGSTFAVEIPVGVSKHTMVQLSKNQLEDLRILVVDDDPEALSYLSSLLETAGLRHTEADTGEKAIEILEKAVADGDTYGACLIDWKMPGLSGAQTAHKIRERFGDDNLIIIASAYEESEVREDLDTNDYNYFVAKPLFASTIFNVLNNAYGGRLIDKTAAGVDFDFSGHTVLVAEDSPINREVIRRLLEKVGTTVVCVEDGKQAVDAFEKEAPGTFDVILMDVNMPVMGGYDATKFIRNLPHEDAKTIPIFALTANAFTSDAANALAAGMNGHLIKPIDTRKLFATLQASFKN